MAMTKKEQEAFRALTQELLEERAFGWPREAEPKAVNLTVFQDENPGVLFQGYTFNTHRALTGYGNVRDAVMKGCSKGGHAVTELYNEMPTKTTTQGPGGPWYRTEREAWLACRWELCRKVAAMLANIDERIANAAA